MKKMCLAFITALALTLSTAHAADFDKGLAAAKAGNYAAALIEFSELAEQGHAGAQFNLGLMYGNGFGVTQDYAEAVNWYTLAAEQGHAGGQFSLGMMYDFGEGVLRDYAAAVKWYELAAKQGFASAQFNLGVMYYSSDGVLQNYVLAHMWANIAAANGYSDGTKFRDLAAREMAQADIETAQKMARECMASNYKNCGY